MIGQLLGWRNPRPNDFQGPDQRPLRDLFGNLQQFMTWPHVGLRFDGTFAMSTVAVTVVPMVVKSAAASPFVPGDPYSLYRPATSLIQVPQDFDTWLAVGAAGFLTGTMAAGVTATLGWRINAVTDMWMTQATRSVVGQCREVTPIVAPVRKGDTLEISATVTTASNLNSAEAWVFFLPLA